LELVGIKAEGLEDMIEKCDQLIIELQEKRRKGNKRENKFTDELKSKVNKVDEKSSKNTTHEKNELIDDKER
jgi:flagellar hook-basal body complex protein FliE